MTIKLLHTPSYCLHALLLFSANPQPTLTLTALQSEDNAYKIARTPWNPFKKNNLRKRDLPHWKSTVRFSKCKPCNLFPSFQTYLHDHMEKAFCS